MFLNPLLESIYLFIKNPYSMTILLILTNDSPKYLPPISPECLICPRSCKIHYDSISTFQQFSELIFVIILWCIFICKNYYYILYLLIFILQIRKFTFRVVSVLLNMIFKAEPLRTRQIITS